MAVALLYRFLSESKKNISLVALLWIIGVVTFPWQGLHSQLNVDDSFARRPQLHSCEDELSAFIHNFQRGGEDHHAHWQWGTLIPLPPAGSLVDDNLWRAFSLRYHRLLLGAQLFSSDL
jgi:hypothetical protein